MEVADGLALDDLGRRLDRALETSSGPSLARRAGGLSLSLSLSLLNDPEALVAVWTSSGERT